MFDIASATDNATVEIADVAARPPTPIERARAAFVAMLKAGTDELTHAMTLGDALIEIRKTAPKRGWQRYARDVVGVPKNTAAVAIRLARARGAIDLDRVRSIREALRLLSKSAPSKKSVTKDRGAASNSVRNETTSEERRAWFAAADFDTCLTEFPVDWFKKLDERFTLQMLQMEKRERKAVEPSLQSKMVKALRLALSHADNGNDVELIAVLHGINRMLAAAGCDLHDVNFSVAKPKVVRRRAA